MALRTHHALGDGAVVVRAQVAGGAAKHRQGQVLQAVRPAARVGNHTPAGHVAERAGRHVAVLALPGQELHGGAQLRLI